jgi:hypothetical protein
LDIRAAEDPARDIIPRPTATMKPARRVAYDEVDETWSRFYLSERHPAAILTWIDEHLLGPWAMCIPGEEEMAARSGPDPNGRPRFVLAFQWQDDADRFQLWYSVAAGQA